MTIILETYCQVSCYTEHRERKNFDVIGYEICIKQIGIKSVIRSFVFLSA